MEPGNQFLGINVGVQNPVLGLEEELTLLSQGEEQEQKGEAPHKKSIRLKCAMSEI